MSKPKGTLAALLAASLLAVLCLQAVAKERYNNPAQVKSLLFPAMAVYDETVFTAGERGYIARFDRQGELLGIVESGTDVLLTSLTMLPGGSGWITGHEQTILYTGDGGNSWSPASVRQGGAGDGEAGDDSAGASFMDYMPDASGEPLKDALFDLQALDASTLFAVGAFGSFLYSTDGGKTWEDTRERLDNEDGWHLYSICQVPGEAGDLYIAGEAGTLFTSADAGETWQRLDTGYEGSFFGVSCFAADHVLVYGLQGTVFFSDDQGQSWRRVEHSSRNGLSTSLKLDESRTLLAGNNGSLVLFDPSTGTARDYEDPRRLSWTAVVKLDEGKVILSGERGVRLVDIGEVFDE